MLQNTKGLPLYQALQSENDDCHTNDGWNPVPTHKDVLQCVTQ